MTKYYFVLPIIYDDIESAAVSELDTASDNIILPLLLRNAPPSEAMKELGRQSV